MRARMLGVVVGAVLLGGCDNNSGDGLSGYSGEGDFGFYTGSNNEGGIKPPPPPPPPAPPSGTLTAAPTTVIEGAPVTFTTNFTDINADDIVTCELDPEGDGTYQLPVACKGSVQFTYQTTGNFTPKAKATDDGGLEGTDTAAVAVTAAPNGIDVTELRLLQAYRVPLSGATVCVYQSPATGCTALATTTDADGVIPFTLAAGVYKMVITRDVQVTLNVEVDNDNASSRFTMITPFDCGATTCANVDSDATFATLQGVARNLATNAPIVGAQVSISGGNATGGPYSTAFTNSNGEYTLTINVGGSTALINALTNSTLRLQAANFAEISSQFSVTERHFTGLNFFLDPNAPAPVRYFRETFETTSNTASGWVAAGGVGDTKWHLHSDNAGVVNTLVPTYVSLAPDDTSGGAVPDAIQGARAYYYGSPTNGSFIGSQVPGDSPDSGGTSNDANLGTLTSPSINLTTRSGAIRLTFQTFWEIESVNPNAGGFDLLEVLMSKNDGPFVMVARLNPLSDPAGGGDRSAKPYSSIGFNAAPLWVQTETIALPDAAGNTIKLQFRFDTKDGLYNGFRGWLIDDVVVEPGQGSLGS